MLLKCWYCVIQMVHKRAAQTLIANLYCCILQHNFEAFQDLPKLGVLLIGIVLIFDYIVYMPDKLRLGNHLEHFGLKFLLLFSERVHEHLIIQ